FTLGGEYLSQFGTKGTGKGEFSSPTGIAGDGKGNVWVLQGKTQLPVQKFNGKGEYLSQFTPEVPGTLFIPLGLALDPEGRLWFAGVEGSIAGFNAEGKYLSRFGSSGSGKGQLGNPRDLVIDLGGGFWITDSVNNRIQRWTF